MKILSSTIHLAIIACLSILNGYSQQRGLINPEKIAKLDSFLQVMSANSLFNGSVLVSENGNIIYKRSAGYYNIEKGILNSSKTPFNLASASKPFTATAILQLVQKGKISLEDPVTQYLTDFRYNNILVKNLLTHTSGLPRIEDVEKEYTDKNPGEVISNAKAYNDLIRVTDALLVKPGEKFQYNNINFFLLSMIIEKVMGMTFPDYMETYIFKPSGMKNTYIRQAGNANTPRYILPTMYSARYEHVDSLNKSRFYTYYQLGSLPGPNNVVSTLEDLNHFDIALDAGKIVDMKLLNEAFTPALLNNGKNIRMGGVRTYGYGWNIMNEPVKDKTVFHDGHIIGLTTMIFKNPAKKLTIFFYDNNDSRGLFQIVGNISRILIDEPLNVISLKRSAVRAFGETLVTRGLAEAKIKLENLRADTARYYFDELEMNSLGYDLLYRDPSAEHKLLSVEVFKMNTEFFPTHPNVYDSYGDALAENGRKEEAIEMYKKVMQLNPGEQSTRKKLDRLSQ
jgi:CubicO group peptidase (beta-lactamase class C family)